MAERASGYVGCMTSMDDIEPQGDAVEDSAVDRLRDAPVGTNDPNIVGDVGPTDVPPGIDPPDIDPPADDPAASDPLTEVDGPTSYGQTAKPAT